MKPGVKTSEFYVTAAVVLAGLAALFGLAPKSADALADAITQVGGALTALGAAWAYAKNRAKIKSEAIEPAFGFFEEGTEIQSQPGGKVLPPKPWPDVPKATNTPQMVGEMGPPLAETPALAPELAEVVGSVQILAGAVSELVGHLKGQAPKADAYVPLPGYDEHIPLKAAQD